MRDAKIKFCFASVKFKKNKTALSYELCDAMDIITQMFSDGCREYRQRDKHGATGYENTLLLLEKKRERLIFGCDTYIRSSLIRQGDLILDSTTC